ncbi:unnamed protein product, partial [Clonostachys byssicola]
IYSGGLKHPAKIASLSSKTLADKIRARAGPNVRLVQTFQIINSFTTADESIDRQFLRRAAEIIKSANAKGWVQAHHVASETVAALCCANDPVGVVNIEHICRAMCFVAAADVESLHHHENIWGLDALGFRPSRFETLSQNQKDAFMPFGIGRHACPAGNSFAGKLIAILVVTLIKQLETAETGTKIQFNDEELDDECNVAVSLPTGRSATKNWVVYPNPEA